MTIVIHDKERVLKLSALNTEIKWYRKSGEAGRLASQGIWVSTVASSWSW